MPSQIVLAWTVDVKNTSFGPAQAAAALAAVRLYDDPNFDPVLGQNFALTVDTDVTTPGPTSATRTLTLNMGPTSVSPFPCHPITSTPPKLPYELRKTITLAGSFFVTQGSMVVQTTATQIPALSIGDSIQFGAQEGVFYQVGVITPTSITLASPYTGTTINTTAFKEVTAPAKIVAAYSSSDDDTSGVATVPPIQPGTGALVVVIEYFDSTGAGPFAAQAILTGKRPAEFVLDPGSKDVAVILELVIAAVGPFGNSVGQITMVELSDHLPPIPVNATPRDFQRLTDEAQLLITQALVYLPNSYFSLAAQQASAPQLEGDFFVTTGLANVPTSVDQTSVLEAGFVIQFASQLANNTPFGSEKVFYTIKDVTPKLVTLEKAYTGIVLLSDSQDSGVETKGVKGTQVINLATGATLITPTPTLPPTNDQLSGPLAQFVQTQVAAPPPKPPLSPATVPAPTFLSDLFTQTIQLALAGVPVAPQPIAFV